MPSSTWSSRSTITRCPSRRGGLRRRSSCRGWRRCCAPGTPVHVVYEACGFGFGLYRQLVAAGAHCYVIAPRKLDEQRTGVKTDPRDAPTLCQRLSRYVDGNTRELAVIRVPSEEEEQARHIHRQREQLVRHRQKLQAQGAACWSITVCRRQPTGGRTRPGAGCSKLLPAWIAAAPGDLPAAFCLRSSADRRVDRAARSRRARADPSGLGKLTSVVLTPRSLRLAVASRTGAQSAATPAFAPANTAAGANACQAA